MAEAIAYLNGVFLPQSQAQLPLNDSGFIFGATVTDLCRTYRHKLFRWPDHLSRFRRSCRAACVPQPLTDDKLTHIAQDLVEQNVAALAQEDDLSLVIFATPGPVGYYAGQEGGPGDGTPTLGMHTFPLPWSRYRRLFSEGAHLVIPSTRHVSSLSVDPRIKQRSRLHWWLAEQEVRQQRSTAHALLLDDEGCVTETAGANLLLVLEGRVVSPPRHKILPGVSLKVVEELCHESGIPFEEKPLKPYDCLNAAEALLTSTPYGVAGVSRIGEASIPWPGPILGRLLSGWNRLAGLDICEQILRSR